MSKKAVWPTAIFAAYLALQIILPAYRLFRPKPVRFGWQMFAASSLPTRVWIVSTDCVEEIDPASYIGNYRSDLDYERYVPPHICRQSGVRSVRYLMPLEAEPREHKC